MGSYQGERRLYRAGITLSAIRYRKAAAQRSPRQIKKVVRILLICSCRLLFTLIEEQNWDGP